ncbi:SH3 domain-containing protein [Alteripontixanthobacter maritimus]|nr:SH3 domain-containing protein [Alteripontixanthobacter maritimus]
MRVGPGPDFPIEWVYKRENLPITVVRRHEGFRLVRDPDGAQGWISASLLSETRTAIVIGDGVAEMREKPSADAKLLWRVEPGRTGRLGACKAGWCRFNTEGHQGWIPDKKIYGDGEPAK